ncbi:hypothetical protein B4Q13_21000, partial [Lacticaseibacillus rhamnosus]
ATGFREYDARWLFGKEINLMGIQALGLGLGTLMHELGVKPELVTGHDFRSYSASIKMALITGLMSAGIKVKDIGLAVTPMAYFAQFALDCPCVAMVTVFTGFIGLFKTLGLGTATIQAPQLTTSQLNGLFWLNVAFGTLAMAIKTPQTFVPPHKFTHHHQASAPVAIAHATHIRHTDHNTTNASVG